MTEKTPKYKFICEYCSRRFVSESVFMRHECAVMKKSKATGTVNGKAAYNHYCYWLKKKTGNKVPPMETFIASRYFNAFLQFVEFSKLINLPLIQHYIDLMVEKDLSPMIWTRTECYSIYLQWYDNEMPPMKQVDVSVETILNMAEKSEIAPDTLFDFLDIRDIMQLIRERKLSPWFLLCSSKFKQKLKVASQEETKHIMRLIGIDYWAEKVENNPQLISNIKLITSALGV